MKENDDYKNTFYQLFKNEFFDDDDESDENFEKNIFVNVQ